MYVCTYVCICEHTIVYMFSSMNIYQRTVCWSHVSSSITMVLELDLTLPGLVTNAFIAEPQNIIGSTCLLELLTF